MTEDATELWRDWGDRPEDDGLGEWPSVYETALDGGVMTGPPSLVIWLMGECADPDAMLAAEMGE
jgi:hypothetical protein